VRAFALSLLAGMLVVAPIALTAAEEDPFQNVLKWDKAHRNEVPRTSKKVPAAEALVRRANSLLLGDPTCAQMREASKLLDKASDLYGKANEAGGDQRTLVRRVSWLEDIADAGKCRK
jgi:hypothetical protein